jgi:hypothetical protein
MHITLDFYPSALEGWILMFSISIILATYYFLRWWRNSKRSEGRESYRYRESQQSSFPAPIDYGLIEGPLDEQVLRLRRHFMKNPDMDQVLDWMEYETNRKTKLLDRVDRVGFCSACQSIATDGVSGFSHHNYGDLETSGAAVCLLCAFFYQKAEQMKSAIKDGQYSASSIRDLWLQDVRTETHVDFDNWKVFFKLKVVSAKEMVFDISRAPDPPEGCDSYLEFASQILGQDSLWTETGIESKVWDEWKDMSAPGSSTPLRLIARDPISDESVARARDWLRRCQETHPRCQQAAGSALPTRLLRIEGNLVFLNELKDYEELHPPYAALSYCWGSSKTIKTTSRTIHARRKGIFIDYLPKTLADAVIVAKSLEIEYIWIDALCIVQDSEKDWEAECVRMGEYYSNAIVTISALDTVAVTGGFLAEREGSLVAPLHPNAAGNLWLRDPVSTWAEVFRGAALNKRGWALQETIVDSCTALRPHRNVMGVPHMLSARKFGGGTFHHRRLGKPRPLRRRRLQALSLDLWGQLLLCRTRGVRDLVSTCCPVYPTAANQTYG